MFAAGLVLLAAIGTAASLSTFAIAWGLLARPLPYPDGDRLAVIWQVHQGQAGQISYPDFRDLTGGALFEAASAMSGGRGSLRVGDRIKRVNLLSLQPEGYFMLGAAPALGRLLRADDAGSNHVLVSDRLWRTHLGADPDVVGQGIWLSGTTYTIVGVLEPGFDFELPVGPFERERHDLWALFDAGQMAERRDVSGRRSDRPAAAGPRPRGRAG
jgi:hypothetical protein